MKLIITIYAKRTCVKLNPSSSDVNLRIVMQIHVRQTDMNSSLSKGLPMMMGYDGIMEAYAEKMEDFVALFESEEYKSLVIPDEERFVDRSQFKMFIGYEEIHWDRDDDKSFSS